MGTCMLVLRLNEISAVNDQMENGFNRVALEKDTVLNAFNSSKIEMEQANKDTALKQRGQFYFTILSKNFMMKQ